MQPIERECGRKPQLTLDLPRDLELERKLPLERELELEIVFFRGRRQRAQPLGIRRPRANARAAACGAAWAACAVVGRLTSARLRAT